MRFCKSWLNLPVIPAIISPTALLQKYIIGVNTICSVPNAERNCERERPSALTAARRAPSWSPPLHRLFVQRLRLFKCRCPSRQRRRPSQNRQRRRLSRRQRKSMSSPSRLSRRQSSLSSLSRNPSLWFWKRRRFLSFSLYHRRSRSRRLYRLPVQSSPHPRKRGGEA